MCDPGRYGFGPIDDPSRILSPRRRDGEKIVEVGWEEITPLVAQRLGQYRSEEIGILASPRMSNEDLFALSQLAEQLGVRNVDFRVPPREPGFEDQILIKADNNPNTKGAELIGLLPRGAGLGAVGMLRTARAGGLKCLWVFHHDLLGSAWPEAETLEALLALDCLIFQGSNDNGVSPYAQLVLPSATYAESEGSYTNFEGRVQRFRKALPPLGE